MPLIQLSTGARLHYVDTGHSSRHSTPVITLHGLLGTAEHDMGKIIAWLRAEYRVIGPTFRGFGQSEPKPRTFPYDFYQRDAADVLAFMDALQIEQAHIIGYSDGGEVTLLAASASPERFRSVMTIGAVGYFGATIRPIAQSYYPADWITPELCALHGIDNPDAFILRWIRAIVHIIDSGGDLSLSQVHQISAPLLMLLGEADRLNPVEFGQRLVERVPNGRLETFQCGHGVHKEAWDDFCRTARAFLDAAES
jgi:valacyclovir hydrolase